MLRKVAMTLGIIAILFSIPLFSQEGASEEPSIAPVEEPAIEEASTFSLEEVTADSPTSSVGVEPPAVVDAQEPSQAQPAAQPASSSDYTVVGQAGLAKTYFDGVNTYANSLVRFKLRSSDNFQTDQIKYVMDDTGELDYTDPFSIDEEGRHSIQYYSIDRIGNIENKKVFSVYIDNTPPDVVVTTEIPVVNIDGRYYISSGNTISIAARDNMSGVNNIKYSLDGGVEWVDYSTSFRLNAEGDISFMVKAEDNVANSTQSYRAYIPDVSGNNVMQQNESIEFYVDRNAPAVEITADREFLLRAGRNVAGSDYLYTITANDEESGIKDVFYRIDGRGAFRKYESEIKLTSNGEHFIEAKAVDNVGNVSDIKILSVLVDIIPPRSSIETITDDEESQELE